MRSWTLIQKCLLHHLESMVGWLTTNSCCSYRLTYWEYQWVSETFRNQQHVCLSSYTECPSMVETTALGAAIAAGLATGVWSDLSTLPDPTLTSYQPSIGHDGLCVPLLCYTFIIINSERDARFARWKEAVQRSRHWHKTGTTQKSSVTREQKGVCINCIICFESFLFTVSAMGLQCWCCCGSSSSCSSYSGHHK